MQSKVTKVVHQSMRPHGGRIDRARKMTVRICCDVEVKAPPALHERGSDRGRFKGDAIKAASEAICSHFGGKAA